MDHEFRAGTQGWTIVGQIAHRFKSAWKKSFDLDLCINALTGISPALYVNVTLFFRFRIWIYEKTGPFQTAGFSWNSACHGNCFLRSSGWTQLLGWQRPLFGSQNGGASNLVAKDAKGWCLMMIDDICKGLGGRCQIDLFRGTCCDLPRMVIHDTFKSLSDFQWDFVSQLEWLLLF